MTSKDDVTHLQLENTQSYESGVFHEVTTEPDKAAWMGLSHGTVELYTETGDLRLVPTPSRDPNG